MLPRRAGICTGSGRMNGTREMVEGAKGGAVREKYCG